MRRKPPPKVPRQRSIIGIPTTGTPSKSASVSNGQQNRLYYGDNLEILRKYVKSESVDLCYIDPPFNSKRNYNQIYNNIGVEDKAQAQAFVDTWEWGLDAEVGLKEILENFNGTFTHQTIELIKGLSKVLGANGSLMAYLGFAE